jgi:hypothetical protein
MLRSLDSYVPFLEQQKMSSPFGNDVYEAVVYWRDLGQWVLEGNTRVNYPVRASEEKALLSKLLVSMHSRPQAEQERYAQVFEVAGQVLQVVGSTQPSKGGHLGTVAIIKKEFRFLQTDYGFKITDEQPTSVRFSSGSVYIELQSSEEPSLSCSFGPEDREDASFWLDDMLFLYGDMRYRTVQDRRTLRTRDQVEAWFAHMAALWKEYGDEVLSNKPGIFDRLADAQARRDAEYTANMSRKHGG